MGNLRNCFPPATGLASPRGHYSHVAQDGGWVFVSGQLPLDESGSPQVTGALEVQAELALSNVATALAAAGCSWEHVLKTTVYLAGVEYWPAFDAVYRQFLGAARPARAVVPVPALHHGALVEIEAIAFVGDRANACSLVGT